MNSDFLLSGVAIREAVGDVNHLQLSPLVRGLLDLLQVAQEKDGMVSNEARC